MDESAAYIVEDLRKYFDQEKVWSDFVGLEYESAVEDILRQLLEEERLDFRNPAHQNRKFLYRYALPYIRFSMQHAACSRRGNTSPLPAAPPC